MSSAKQIEANRRNAQKSKGPRTAAGKARASCNSRKHALSTISRSNPRFAPRIECIARAICAETANSGLWEQALIIGECATVLGCVQAERIALIEQLLGGTTARTSDAEGAGRAKGAGSVELEAPQCKRAPLRDELDALGLAARDLNRLERYERHRDSHGNQPHAVTPEGLRRCDLELMKNEDTTKSQFLAERTQIPHGGSSFHGGLLAHPSVQIQMLGPVNHFPRRDRLSRGALRIWGSRPRDDR
jgi:hypothetical protein